MILPGFCAGDLAPIVESARGIPVELGPEDLRDLPRHFGHAGQSKTPYGQYDIEILAEINHAPGLDRLELLRQADLFQSQGADVIDLGCIPGTTWTQVGDAVEALRDRGIRVSIDSFDPAEIELAVSAGAELVLSVNATNRQHAPDWGVEVVAIPDQPGSLTGLDETIEFLRRYGVPFRIDPILEPIGFGFAPRSAVISISGARYPDTAMIMGVGNLTELTDVDSAGVNTILVGLCQELRIQSVLTTAVINWAQSSVKELDLARRLAHHAVKEHTLPKHLEPRLVALRDPKVVEFGTENLAELQRRIRDPNWRIFAEGGMIHALNNKSFLSDPDPFVLFDQMRVTDASHAFYLGYELMKAKTALTLSKSYRQDQALEWGFLTEPEVSHRSRSKDRSTPRETRRRSLAGRGERSREPRRGTSVILEGIVTTLSPDGTLNVAPMGPRVDSDMNMTRFVLRPFSTSTTYHNLKARGEGVFHVTDDVLLLAQTAIGAAPSPAPAARAADVVAGQILTEACRYYEFRVIELDDREERTAIVVETVAQGRQRDFFGFNRAKHAVVEAAILATRADWLAVDEILARVSQTGDSRRQDRWATRASRLYPRTPACTRDRRETWSRKRPESLPSMTNRTIRIRTPSRLHFGLLGWGFQRSRQFGGVGLMIDAPGIEVVIEPATSWIVDGALSSRVDQLISQLRSTMCAVGTTLRPVRIHVERAPAEHVGLGVGTQLCLAVARAILVHAGFTDISVENLARMTGRGLRSGIGLHGFEHGGLVVDGGRRTEIAIPPLLARLPFPEDWSILIVQPQGQTGLYGRDERQVFATLPPIAQDVTDSLCRLVLLEILPAVIERDLAAIRGCIE